MRIKATVILILLCMSCTANASGIIDTTFRFGINMQQFKPWMRNNGLKQLFVDTLGMNCFHGFLNFDGSAKSWCDADDHKVTALIVSNSPNGAINNFSGFFHCEFIQYFAGSRPTDEDIAIKNFYFIHRSNSDFLHGTADSANPDVYWKVRDSTSHTRVPILDSNEIVDGPPSYTFMWTGQTTTPFRLAVKLKIDSLKDTSLNVISIEVTQHHFLYTSGNRDTTYTVPPWDIKWDSIHTTGGHSIVLTRFF